MFRICLNFKSSTNIELCKFVQSDLSALSVKMSDKTRRKHKVANEKGDEGAKKKKVDNNPIDTGMEYPIKEEINGKRFNLKIVSWNVAGLRAWFKKNAHEWLLTEDPNIICLQETKCSKQQVPENFFKLFKDYKMYWHLGEKPGYSGTCLMSKEKPLNVTYDIGVAKHDNEGRTITAEYNDYFVVTTYVPNAQRKLARLDYRQEWDKDFQAYLKSLDAKKPVILNGDLNVSHREIDLKNPKANKRNAGFSQEERDGMTTLFKENIMFDTFRHLYPKREGAYTFWTNMGGARARNVGWRLDYFIIPENMKDNLCDSVIHSQILGSDHCPISLLMAI